MAWAWEVAQRHPTQSGHLFSLQHHLWNAIQHGDNRLDVKMAWRDVQGTQHPHNRRVWERQADFLFAFPQGCAHQIAGVFRLFSSSRESPLPTVRCVVKGALHKGQGPVPFVVLTQQANDPCLSRRSKSLRHVFGTSRRARQRLPCPSGSRTFLQSLLKLLPHFLQVDRVHDRKGSPRAVSLHHEGPCP